MIWVEFPKTLSGFFGIHVPKPPCNFLDLEHILCYHKSTFDDEEQIKDFLEMLGEFSNLEIDQEDGIEGVQEDESSKNLPLKNSIGDQKIMQLKNNVIPKGLVPLERLLNTNDVVIDTKKTNSEDGLEDCNLGTEQQPKMVRLAKDLSKNFK